MLCYFTVSDNTLRLSGKTSQYSGGIALKFKHWNTFPDWGVCRCEQWACVLRRFASGILQTYQFACVFFWLIAFAEISFRLFLSILLFTREICALSKFPFAAKNNRSGDNFTFVVHEEKIAATLNLCVFSWNQWSVCFLPANAEATDWHVWITVRNVPHTFQLLCLCREVNPFSQHIIFAALWCKCIWSVKIWSACPLPSQEFHP